MIILSAPIQQDKLIDLLTSYNEGGLSFQFVEKKGIKLYFETTLEDKEQAAKSMKQIIKDTPWGAVLFFQVAAE